jgi:hypothetical protein
MDILDSKIEIPKSLTFSSSGEIIVMGNFINSSNDSSAFVATFNSSGLLLRDYSYELVNRDISLSRNIIEGLFAGGNSYVMCFNEFRTFRASPTILSVDPGSLEIGDSPPFGSDNYAENISEIRKYSLDNYMMIGKTDSISGNSILVYRVSQFGELIWEKTYGSAEDPLGGNAAYTGNSVCESLNGGFILLGTKIINNSNSDFYLVKTDGNGTVQWAESIGGEGEESGYQIESVPGGYLLLGTAEIAGTKLITLVKTDLQGKVIK